MFKILWVATMLLRISRRDKAFQSIDAQKNSPRLISGAFVVLCELFNSVVKCVKLLNNVVVDVSFVFCVSHKRDDVLFSCACR